MISKMEGRALPGTAPALVRDLRSAFDARLMELWHEAAQKEPADPTDGLERTVHVDFVHEHLRVTAVFNCMSEQFTQLIARDLQEDVQERPTYTISLFL